MIFKRKNSVVFLLGLLFASIFLLASFTKAQGGDVQNGTPWAWYVTRASGLVGFLLLYVSTFLGLAIKTPILRKIIEPSFSCQPHCWISLQALIFAFLHGFALLFDKYLNFGLKDILIPFASNFSPNLIALGIISFYLMIILVVSSYFRKFISNGLWRFFHSLNVALYVFTVAHSLYLGTDLKNPIFRNIFLAMNAFLAMLMIANLLARLFGEIKTDEINSNCPVAKINEDLHQSNSAVIEE